MAGKLTEVERDTLNAAMAIIGRYTPAGSSYSFDSARYRDLGDGRHFFGVTYFDSNEGAARGQHSSLPGKTFADKIQKAIDLEASATERAEHQRRKHVEQLRAQLAKLEDAA